MYKIIAQGYILSEWECYLNPSSLALEPEGLTPTSILYFLLY